MSASSQSLGLAESRGSDTEEDKHEYEMEDPAEAWIALVAATRIKQPMARDSAVRAQLFKAKNSHWTLDLWHEVQEEYDSPTMGGDADEGGDYSEASQYESAANIALPPVPDREPDAVIDLGPVHHRTKQTAPIVCPWCGLSPCGCRR